MTTQATAFVFAVGEIPQLWVNGQHNVLAVPPGSPAGTLAITDVLELGRGGRPTNPPIGYFKGRCSFLGLCARRQPDEVLRSITQALVYPMQVYGHGTVNRRADAIKSPVAMPAWTTTASGTAVTVNVGAVSYDPGGLALTCSAANVLTGNGGVSRSGSTITITPASDTVAGDLVECEYTIRNSSGKTSSNRVTATVSGTAVPAVVDARDDAFAATAGVAATYSPLSNDVPSTGVTITAIGTLTGGSTASIILPGRTQISYTPHASTTNFSETLTYTMSDGATSNTATITFTVTGTAAPPVLKANPNNYNATAGVEATYSPLDNDTLTTGVTITALTVPSGGSTASIVSGTTVKYKPHASAANFTESVGYTIRDSLLATSTSAMTFTVAGVSAPTGRLKTPATVANSRIRTVGYAGPTGSAQYSTLTAAYAAAQPGDHIYLNDGSYGTFVFDKSGLTAANPIVIRSRNVANGRSPMGNVTGLWSATQPGHWFYELRFTRTSVTSNEYSLNISRSDTTVTRCWFHTCCGISVASANIQRINIGWNRFVTNNSRIGAFLKITVSDPHGSPTAAMNNSAIYRNYFNKTVTGDRPSDSMYNIYIGNAHANSSSECAIMSEVYIEENYFTGVNKMVCYLKRGITSFSYNVLRTSDSGAGICGFRHGTIRYASPSSANTQPFDTCMHTVGNRVFDLNEFVLGGAGHLVMGNHLSGGVNFAVAAGSKNGSVQQAASDSTFVSNYCSGSGTGAYLIGDHRPLIDPTQGGEVRNVHIYNHTGGSITSSTILSSTAFAIESTVVYHTGTGTGGHPEAPNPQSAANWNPDTDVGFQVAGQGTLT